MGECSNFSIFLFSVNCKEMIFMHKLAIHFNASVARPSKAPQE